jgi:hypothetical protein
MKRCKRPYRNHRWICGAGGQLVCARCPATYGDQLRARSRYQAEAYKRRRKGAK